MAFADVGIVEPVRVVAVGELLECGGSREDRRRCSDRTPCGNLEVIATAEQIDVSEHLGGGEELPEFLDTNEEPAGHEGGVLWGVAVVGRGCDIRAGTRRIPEWPQ